jgi:hypothetical protein
MQTSLESDLLRRCLISGGRKIFFSLNKCIFFGQRPLIKYSDRLVRYIPATHFAEFFQYVTLISWRVIVETIMYNESTVHFKRSLSSGS